MKTPFRDRQALKRLRKMEQSASLRIGEHITSAFVRPWRLPFLPVTFPFLCFRIGLERLGLMEQPEQRVEWERPSDGHGVLVYIDGFTKQHAKHVRQDLEDVKRLQSTIDVSVVCTGEFQSVFKEAPFPVFVLPDKNQIPINKSADWGTLLEEQIGGIAAFTEPHLVLIVGPYPHRALKNLVRSNPNLKLILDQRPNKVKRKEAGLSFYTHLSGVLRNEGDVVGLPGLLQVHTVGEIGLASWIANSHQGLDVEFDESLKFNISASNELIDVAKNAERDTTIITSHLEELNAIHDIEKTYALVQYTLLVLEQVDTSHLKSITRDLFVGAVRFFGIGYLEHMVELAEWRMSRYQDERAAKSVIQFLRNADRPTEATAFLKYVKDEEWKKKEIKTVTSKMLSSYGIEHSSGFTIKTLGDFQPEELAVLIREELEQGKLMMPHDYMVQCGKNTLKKVDFLIKILNATKDIHNEQLLNFLLKHALFSHDSKQLAYELNHAFMMYGRHEEAVKALIAGPTDLVEDLKLKSQTISDKINKKWLSSIPKVESVKSFVCTPGKILYLVHMSLPYESAGYCTRTHGLLTKLHSINPDIVVQGRFGYPLDKGKLRHLAPDDIHEQVVIDGLTYRFDKDVDLGIGDPDEATYIHRASEQLVNHALIQKPALIQAASNHVNGAIGLKAARALGIPFVYEVRGLWHMSRVSRQPHFLHHAEYQAMDEAEIAVCMEADSVLTITHAVRHYLVGKGVEAAKIFVLPNGVDSSRFQPVPEDIVLRKSLNLKDGPVIGYIGSFVGYEGLHLLVDAFAKVVQHYPMANLLLVGDGDTRQRLEIQTKELGLEDHVVFTGRVAHDEVEKYHSLIDIAPFPRTPDIVCEFISPLKPFESMAMGQVVVASNVAALDEIITDGENGRLFKKGDSHSLAETINALLSDERECRRLAEAGTSWVRVNRDWAALANYLHTVHTSILEKTDPPALLGTGRALQLVNGQVMTMLDRTPVIMAIMDEFSATALAPDAVLIRPTPESWQSELENTMIDALIVESAWEGNQGSWHHMVGYYNEDKIRPLRTLVEECRRRNIPTIFYNKEDPVHYDRFAPTSTMFDHVFTTDEQCIVRYETLPNSNIQSVHSIQFAAQPTVHHPYDTTGSSRHGIAFAGTYYSGKYPDRCDAMDMLFEASVKHSLTIYDRQSDGGNPNYVFPSQYSSNVREKLAYPDMLEAHRRHKIFLNVNSVQTSKTMAARRIFEIPASGACLVSGPGLAVRETFGNIVPIVSNSQEAEATIETLVNTQGLLQFITQKSREIVLRHHLNAHRLSAMLQAAGLMPSSSAESPVVYLTDQSTDLLELMLWVARQSRFNGMRVCLPSNPSTSAEVIMHNLLSSRGLLYDQPEKDDASVRIEVYTIKGTDHEFLEYLHNEWRASQINVEIRTPENTILARVIHDQSKGFKFVEYGVLEGGPQLDISTIRSYNFTSVPKTILVAGHDLKFANSIIHTLEEMGIQILVDQWQSHNRFDAEVSQTLLAQADAVWCEWALGNVVWYSQNISERKPLFVRYHLQERNYNYFEKANKSRITNIGFVCEFYRKHAVEIGQLPKGFPTSVIPNALETKEINQRSNNNFDIGFVGMVPSRKRLDLALDLIEELLHLDSRYSLKVVGKRPQDYDWLMKRDEERAYYDEVYQRIQNDITLSHSVEFLGFVDNIREFYASVGHVVSTSDFESFHLTLADGPLQGAAAHTLDWEGADTIYTDLWKNTDIKEMARTIHSSNINNETAYIAARQTKHLIGQMQPEVIALSILQALSGGLDNE